MARAKTDSRFGKSRLMTAPFSLSPPPPMRNWDGNVLTDSREKPRLFRGASVPVQLPEQPGTGESPVTLGGRTGDAEYLGRFLEGASREDTEFHDLGLLRMLLFELIQCVVQGQQIDRILARAAGQFRVFNTVETASPFLRAVAAGVVDEDAAHGLGGRGEEMPAGIPILGLLRVHQTEVSLVDHGGGLKRLTPLLLCQLLGGPPAQ